MPSSPLQKVPLGLLQALSLQTLGLAPTQFSDTVSPTLDAFRLYLLDLAQTPPARETTSVTAKDAGSLVTVPAGEIWLVEAAYADVQVPAAAVCPDGIGIRLDYRRSPSPTGVSLNLASYFLPAALLGTPVAAMGFFCAAQFPSLLPLRADSGVAARLSVTTTTAVSVTVRVDYYRVPV